jgi:hypothetical protein
MVETSWSTISFSWTLLQGITVAPSQSWHRISGCPGGWPSYGAQNFPTEINIKLIIIVITYMPVMYNYILKTDRTSKVHNFASILFLGYLAQVLFFRINILNCYISTFRSRLFVQRQIWLFSVVPRNWGFQYVAHTFSELFLDGSSCPYN